jgi:MFS-type transporter involved in bile tolerance (Atg22 family)
MLPAAAVFKRLRPRPHTAIITRMRDETRKEPLHPTVKATGWVLYGVFFGATEGVAKAFVADLVPAERRGTAFGLLGMAEGLLVLPASLLCGFLWDTTGTATWSLVLGGAFALAAACVLLVLVPARPGGH